MTYLVAFDRPVMVPNGQGGQQQTWQEQLQAFARFRFLRGSETVIAARLEGRQPVVVSIYTSAVARQIDTDWRMRDARTGETYEIRTVVPSDDRGGLELTCESGVEL